MLRARLPLAPFRRLPRRVASLCAAGALLLPAGCQINPPMKQRLLNAPSAPGPRSSNFSPLLRRSVAPDHAGEETADDRQAGSSGLIRTFHQEIADNPTLPDALPAPVAVDAAAAKGVAVNLDFVLRQTLERNGDILAARERVNESQIALDAALRSCMPEALRKDTFKKPVAEATLWRRRSELSKVEIDNLQDAADTYFDWLTAVQGEVVARDLMTYEEKLLDRARKLAKLEKPVQVVVEAIETAVSGRQQYILHTRQQGEAAAAKLASLMGINGGAAMPREMLQPMDRVDISVPVEVLVRQAQDNGPGVRELQGLIAAIQQGIDQARLAQCLCAHTGAALVCGRLQMAQSQLQQAELSLLSLRIKLRAGVEAAFTAVVSGREQLDLASKAIDHAKETYRIMDLRVTEESPETAMKNKTYDGVLNSIRQLSQARANYVTAVSSYNKAQARLLLLLGAYHNCPSNVP
ncbi:MAG TPA: TolC family protein [Gemmataceae bacterium]|nr:TolC family protein [Gemmataceae bacterium]